MSEPRDTFPTDQNAPLGCEKLIEAKIAGTVSLEQLANEEVVAFEVLEDGTLRPVAADHWRSPFAALMWETGYKRHYYASDMSEEERRAWDASAASIFRGEPTTTYPHGPAKAYSYGSEPRLLVVKKAKGRPKGTGLEAADESVITKILKLIAEKRISDTAATWEVIGRDGAGALGSGSPESKVKRLVDRLKAMNRE
jgi:hypothetical protein